MNVIHIRHQNEVLHVATLLLEDNQSIIWFIISLKFVQKWSSRKQKIYGLIKKTLVLLRSRGTETYNSRILALFLMNSMTADFAAMIHSCINPKYSLDGSFLLFTMCAHKHMAFIGSIKKSVCQLSEFKKDNMQTFLNFLQNNLHLITSTGTTDTMHNDLIPHIILQV